MHTIIQRSIWGLIWAASIGIAVWLSADMTKDQPILFAILLVCLAVISVSLVYGRILWSGGAKGSALAAFGVGALCFCVAVVSEISYWSASIEGVHDQIVRDKAKAKGKDLVEEKRRQQLATQVGGQSPEAIQAEMSAELTKVYKGATLAASTLNCTDTASSSYRYCTPYLELKSKFAAAKELRDLEGKVLADSTEIVSTSIRRSFYEAARIGSELVGGDVRTWIAIICGLLVATTMSLHLLGLYIGTAPVRRVDAPGRAKASPATPVAPHPFAPVLRRPVTPEKAFQKPEEGTPSPVPVPGPSPKPLVEAAPVALEIDPTQFFEREMDKQNVVKFTTKQDRKKQRQKSKKNISEGDVTMWFQDCTTRVPEKDIAATSKECWESYQAWCQVNEYKPTSRKDLTRKMGIIWGRAAGSRGPRNADGAIWPGLKVVKPNAQPLRARA